MTPLRLLWRVLTGKDAAETLRQAAMLEAHARRIEALERNQEARDAFHRVAQGNRP